MAAQKINKLNSFFEVKNVSIRKEEALITLAIFSNTPSNTNVGLRFYIEDQTGHSLLSPTFYWVDRYSNTTNENVWTGNEDVNLHKEVVFKIDITNQNRSKFVDLRWVRDIKFVIKADSVGNSLTITLGEVLLVSESIQLISNIVPIPLILDIDIKSFDTDDSDRSLEELAVSIYYDYGIESDFNYVNKNIEYKFQLLNYRNLRAFDQRTLTENGTLDQSNKLGIIKYKFTSLKLRSPFLVSVIVLDKQGNHLANYIKLYRPVKPKNKTYVNYNGTIKEVRYIYSNFTEDNAWSLDQLNENANSVFVSD